MTPKRIAAWVAATTGTVAAAAGALLSAFDGDWSIMLLFIVVSSSSIAVLRLVPPDAVELRPDIDRWIGTASAQQGESPETLVNRLLSRQRALSEVDPAAVHQR